MRRGWFSGLLRLMRKPPRKKAMALPGWAGKR